MKKSWKAGKWSPNSVINADGEIVDARLKGGLVPTPVTRDLTWGVPVPIKNGSDDQGMNGKVLCMYNSGLPMVQMLITLLCRRLGMF